MSPSATKRGWASTAAPGSKGRRPDRRNVADDHGGAQLRDSGHDGSISITPHPFRGDRTARRVGRSPLARLLAPVHLGRGQGEVPKVRREPGPGRRVRRAKPGIVRLTRRHDVLNVRLTGRGEARARVGAVERARWRPRPTAGMAHQAVIPFTAMAGPQSAARAAAARLNSSVHHYFRP